MRPFFKRPIVLIAIIILLGTGGFALFKLGNRLPEAPKADNSKNLAVYKVIGTSVEGRKIESYTYGKGEKRLLFVGGIHGGYEWNSVLLAYKFINYLDNNPGSVPDGLTVSVIPSANPDGVYKVTGKAGNFAVSDVSTSSSVLASGRLNADKVDLNRNFDCKWQPKGVWKNQTVSGGSSAFSEPETLAIKNFISENGPDAVIFWHSQSNAVYASECERGILPETLKIMDVYSRSSGYPAVKSFGAYAVTGDAEGWLASINIPAITVELKTHDDIEWEKNLAGIKSLFAYYSEK